MPKTKTKIIWKTQKKLVKFHKEFMLQWKEPLIPNKNTNE